MRKATEEITRTMGGSSSTEEEKLIESNGQVNNNIVIQEAKDIHEQLATNRDLLYATYFLIILEILKLAMYSFINFKKKLKKKYSKDEETGK